MPNIPMLTSDQEDLLVTMVEAARKLQKSARQKFVVLEAEQGDFLIHPGLPTRPQIYLGDLEELERQRLVAFSRPGQSLNADVTAHGQLHYDIIKGRNWRVTERVEDEARRLLTSDEFQARYADAFRKWSNAEALLWGANTTEVFTQIGHLCREAMQAFVTALVEKYQPTDIDGDKAHTKSRLRAVLQTQASRLPTTPQDFALSLLGYWDAVTSIVQRQEHGSLREGDALVWEDARRAVFQTLILMYEVERLLH